MWWSPTPAGWIVLGQRQRERTYLDIRTDTATVSTPPSLEGNSQYYRGSEFDGLWRPRRSKGDADASEWMRRLFVLGGTAVMGDGSEANLVQVGKRGQVLLCGGELQLHKDAPAPRSLRGHRGGGLSDWRAAPEGRPEVLAGGRHGSRSEPALRARIWGTREREMSDGPMRALLKLGFRPSLAPSSAQIRGSRALGRAKFRTTPSPGSGPLMGDPRVVSPGAGSSPKEGWVRRVLCAHGFGWWLKRMVACLGNIFEPRNETTGGEEGPNVA